ncbi:phosphate ABC transporter permease PstA [Acholeplasma granularum]|uniref:phosphate ABC transporter permease PstA n=1 Tax=Acholeplasma granularum TaxID=264635 RepID=UPI00047122D5|nr:phosphate ABC transporter permease PstA [Acholeplasma granularum]
MNSSQKIKDYAIRIITYVTSFISVFVLGAILIFVLVQGAPLLNLDIIMGDNYNTYKPGMKLEYVPIESSFTYDTKQGEYFSTRYGVAVKDDKTLEGNPIIRFTYVDPNSPMRRGHTIGDSTEKIVSIEVGDVVMSGILFWGDNYLDINGDINPNAASIPYQVTEGAESFVEKLDRTLYVASIAPVILGGGIRGSIVTTLYLILLTLLIALPVGVATALYIHELAPQNKFTDLLRSLIDMLTGVPSIIYGLMGAAFFIPLAQRMFSGQIISGSLISGAMTLSVIVLPVIIRSTESALDVVPKDYKLASLALGANETQTIFKVMLPNALPGILSASLLAIGRIMGESAALIFAIGTVIMDDISIFGQGTSLAVHIWSTMSSENPNFALASTISIVLLAVVLTLNLLIKFITHKFVKRYR